MPSIRRTLTTTGVAAALAVTGIGLTPAAVQAQPARSTVNCGIPGYSPCGAAQLSAYVVHPGDVLGFKTPGAFNPNGLVTPIIDPPNYRHVFPARRANANGVLKSHIRIPRHAPKGRYTLILRGHKHGYIVRVKAHFRVK